MKKAIFYLLACVLLPVAASADEGMWLVSTFRDVIYPQMKKEGLKLKPGEIYNEESPALCNAIVAVDGGMGTGSVISDKGLVITNHHVAYGDIHSLSTPAKNYLEEGFWALEQKDELPLKGKTVTFLRQVRDVTDEAQAIRDSLEKANSLGIFGTRKVYGILERKYGGDTPFEVECASMWKGKKYLLFYYETYKDVRLVGAPPVKIGAFGGEQDNWGWPQHKGDFALYRVYGDAKGRPAAYSENNVPITPRKVLNVSTSGIHDGDYAMVIGFPGRTNRYMSSQAVREKCYYQETWIRPSDVMMTANRLGTLVDRMQRDGIASVQDGDKNFAGVKSNTRRMMKDFDLATDKEVLTRMMESFIDNVPREMWGEQLPQLYDRFKGNVPALVDYAFENTCCTSYEKLCAWFAQPRTAEEILSDPMAAMANSVSSRRFAEKLKQAEETSGIDADKEELRYTHAIYEMRESEGTPQYPDANSTMRLTYGTVGPVSPKDAVHYDSRSTIDGYLEKYNPDDYEFRVDDRMSSLIRSKDWGRWGENGRLYVNFLTNNDITGGNSGSPVLNARGDVIGLAFDGNRESMSGDIYFHPTNFKTVCVDIRFVLWIMDKYAGAGKLIDEMRLVK